MPNAIEIGKKIQTLRGLKGISQQKLAEEVGTTTAAIGNYESGLRVPKDSIKVELAKVLGSTVEFIFFEH